MKIGIYARGLSGVGGVKQYINEMCCSMIRHIKSDDELYIFHNLKTTCFDAGNLNVKEVLLRSNNRFVCDFVLGPKEINTRALDAVWYTKYIVPFGVAAKALTTVHDMAYFISELGAYTVRDTLYMRTMIRNSCRRADHIAAVSASTKQDIVKYTDTPEDKITVIREAANERFRIIEDKSKLDSFKTRHRLEKPYILFTGGISPRKNLSCLVKAFESIEKQIPHNLVLTGTKTWHSSDVLEAIERNPRIVKLGFVKDEDMPLLYNAADLFVYPSLYEGFGLPILEAQACGCPIVCAKNSSLVEVGKDGVIFFNGKNTAELASAMTKVFQLTEQERGDLVLKGLNNAAKYSWDKAAIEMLELIKSL